MAINRKYVSETDKFISGLLQKKPEIKVTQNQLRCTWWDKEFKDQVAQEKFERTEVPRPGYAYYDYSDLSKTPPVSEELKLALEREDASKKG